MTCQFDHERLDVYHLELEFVQWATDLIEEVRQARGETCGEVCDHLDRASLSALLNTAEGNGKRQIKTRARFFDDARGSATECAACLDALVVKRGCTNERMQKGKALLVRIVGMLTKLVSRFSPDDRVHEAPGNYEVECERKDEDDDEDENEDDDENDDEHEGIRRLPC